MCSPVGHSLAALIVGSALSQNRKPWFWLFCLISANFADLDFAIGWVLGDLNGYHHLGSHSLFAAALYALLVYLVLAVLSSNKPVRLCMAALGGVLYLIHLLLDLLAVDESPPFGMQLLWPFSQDFYISPISLFPKFLHDAQGSDVIGMIIGMMNRHNLNTILIEIMVFLPVLFIVSYFSHPFIPKDK